MRVVYFTLCAVSLVLAIIVGSHFIVNKHTSLDGPINKNTSVACKYYNEIKWESVDVQKRELISKISSRIYVDLLSMSSEKVLLEGNNKVEWRFALEHYTYKIISRHELDLSRDIKVDVTTFDKGSDNLLFILNIKEFSLNYDLYDNGLEDISELRVYVRQEQI